ncbi:DUF5133 domain-containing protein [Streptomyces sp. SL13]|jgi:hypothetical protein|uniref:DUF5133 domain-containing protein n=1 Tax=Streptantibioticus silvisoli TaxID=2705255 RepID=A0AA90K9G6_9ACTN|nr:DUF5133 domain-containing protein [Streptantibioticus silvisoli]MDI5964873.1 DUF5133 domain-containing protein [Streptantibioticus silvisoli]MDI5971128.1 DUF5133 domain-containing protein [Streptantibioticus silvisoli]
MQTPHPPALRKLITRYETLRAAYVTAGDPQARSVMNEAAYTLCLATGTRDVDTALLVGQHRLSGPKS